MYDLDISVLLVTGHRTGEDPIDFSSVEVLSAEGVPLDCSLPPLPEPRVKHTQDGLESCGGQTTQTSCVALNLTAGGWVESHQLQQPRHTARSKNA